LSFDAVATTDADLVAVLVGGEWPLTQLAARSIAVFDAVNAGGQPASLRERL